MINVTKKQFIKRIKEIAAHKEAIKYLTSKKANNASLESIPDVHLQVLNKKK